jgi:hypothetical protein
MRALRAAARNGAVDIPCLDVGCECVLSGVWGPWSRWARGPIHGGFSIPAPNPPPPDLRYRANGSVVSRYRYQTGTCFEVRIDA